MSLKEIHLRAADLSLHLDRGLFGKIAIARIDCEVTVLVGAIRDPDGSERAVAAPVHGF
jgi:hypothetical protein